MIVRASRPYWGRERNKITSGPAQFQSVECIIRAMHRLVDIPNTEVWAFQKKLNCFGVKQTDLIQSGKNWRVRWFYAIQYFVTQAGQLELEEAREQVLWAEPE